MNNIDEKRFDSADIMLLQIQHDIRNNLDINNKLQNEISTLSTVQTNINSKLDNIIKDIENIKKDINFHDKDKIQVHGTLDKFDILITNMINDLKDIKEELSTRNLMCQDNILKNTTAFNEMKHKEFMLEQAVASLRKDIADNEDTNSALNKKTHNRLTKLEELQSGYRVIKWVCGTVAAMIGFGLLVFELYEKVFKHTQ